MSGTRSQHSGTSYKSGCVPAFCSGKRSVWLCELTPPTAIRVAPLARGPDHYGGTIVGLKLEALGVGKEIDGIELLRPIDLVAEPGECVERRRPGGVPPVGSGAGLGGRVRCARPSCSRAR